MSDAIHLSPALVPASGWVVDPHGVGHSIRARGPVLYETACGHHLPGPAVDCYTGPKCQRCHRVAWLEEKRRKREENPATQGRLF